MKNKILIGIFIAALIIPSFLWFLIGDYVNVGNSENRALAEKPRLTASAFSDYPQAYEDYYNDHLPFKSILVNSMKKLDYTLFNIVDSEKVLLGEDNWLFYKSAGVPELADEQPIADYQGTNVYTEEEMGVIAENITAVDAYLEGRNIDFSVMICPNKETIYSQYLPDSLTKITDENKAEILVDYLTSNTDVPILFPKEELLQLKDTYQLYFKYDTHWNNLGGFVATQQIRDLYCGEKDSLNDHQIESVENGAAKDLAMMLNMADEFTGDDAYYVGDYKPEVTASLLEVSEDTYFHIYGSDAMDERTVLVICDSYGDAMMDNLAKDYQNVVFIHRGKFNQSHIDQYQPDIIIYEVVERATDDIRDMKLIFGLQ